MKNTFKGKKVLITGNTGFKGSWLTCWLIKLGALVYGISKDIPTKPSMFETLDLENKIEHFFEDITNFEKTKNIIENISPDYIFHMAAQPIVVKSYQNPLETINSNIIGTANVLESLRVINKKCKAVIITSDKCYENVEWEWGYKETDTLGGKDIYSGSKAGAEIIFNSYFQSFFKDNKSNSEIVTVRAGNVIGGGDWADYRIIPDCIKSWVNKKSVVLRSPNATRPWQHVLEPLSGYLCLASEMNKNPKLNGNSFNFGPSPNHDKSVLELIEKLSSYWDLGDKGYIISKEVIKFKEAGLLKLNCDKALFHLRWRPTLNYNELINFTGEWFKSFYDNEMNMFEFTIGQIEGYTELAKSRDLKWAK